MDWATEDIHYDVPTKWPAANQLDTHQTNCLMSLHSVDLEKEQIMRIQEIINVIYSYHFVPNQPNAGPMRADVKQL